MALIGKLNVLRVLREAAPGFYLDGGPLGEILLPGSQRTAKTIPGGDIEVFVYRDSEDRLVATTRVPHAQLDEFAMLRVVAVRAGIGAFLDWGLEKDLLLPIREWKDRVEPGDWVVVKVRMDTRSNRLVASARLDRHLDRTPADYQPRQPVRLLVAGETPLGYFVIINHTHRGLLYAADVAAPLGIGETLDGYVLRVRPDGKIDTTLHAAGFERIGPLKTRILGLLSESDGFLPYHDGSSPAEIHDAFGVSKKAFKQAIGLLYRDRRITIADDGIRLAPR